MRKKLRKADMMWVKFIKFYSSNVQNGEYIKHISKAIKIKHSSTSQSTSIRKKSSEKWRNTSRQQIIFISFDSGKQFRQTTACDAKSFCISFALVEGSIQISSFMGFYWDFPWILLRFYSSCTDRNLRKVQKTFYWRILFNYPQIIASNFTTILWVLHVYI